MKSITVASAALVVALGGAVPLQAAPAPETKTASVQYLVGNWKCAHTVGTFSGTYATNWESVLGGRWLRQTIDFPAGQMQAAPARAEFLTGYDSGRNAWVRFGALSSGDYFAIRMTETADGWLWKYVSFFKTRRPQTPGADARFTKKSNTEYTVDGPTYPKDGVTVTEHHVCIKTNSAR